MQRPWHMPLMVWAARDLLRQPVQTVLLFASLASLVTLLALLLSLYQTVTAAYEGLRTLTPAVVVQRVDTNGWRPLRVSEALRQVSAVAGVIRPRVRVWGIVQAPQGPITVIGATPEVREHLPEGMLMPGSGQALVGPGVLPGADAVQLTPLGRPAMSFTVIARLPVDSGLAGRGAMVLHLPDARALLGLAADQASDLALDVFHEDEARAMVPDIARALSWPARVTTRQEQLGRTLSDLSRRTGMLLVAFVPALLAMALLVAALGAWGRQRRWEIGLFKAVGWSAADIQHLYLYRGALVGVPAVLVGSACAALLLFVPGMTWVSRLLFDWGGPPPVLYLTFRSGLAGLFLSALLVGVPFSAAIFWTGWQAASADPADGIVEGGG